MINIVDGTIQINSESTLYSHLPLDKFKESFDFPFWLLWHWNDEDHHICYRREYLNLDNRHFIAQVHFISRMLFVVDLAFILDDKRGTTAEAQGKILEEFLGKPVDLHTIYPLSWGYLCITKDELGLPSIRVTYQ